jgi:hypothetical protein
MITTNLRSSQIVGRNLAESFDLPRDNEIEYMTEIVVDAENMDELRTALMHDLGIDINEINMNVDSSNGSETSP